MSFHRSSGWVEETTSWCRFFSQRATPKSNRLSLRSLLDGHLGCIRCIPHFHIPDTTVSNLISPDFVINLYGVVPTSISIPTDSRSQQPMRLLLKSSGSGLIGETHPANQKTSGYDLSNESSSSRVQWRWWTMMDQVLHGIFARTRLHILTCNVQWPLELVHHASLSLSQNWRDISYIIYDITGQGRKQ